ncbi:hypothetical protein B1992_12105 [Pseudoxanthomonas broegbernensis]|uniref:Proline-rich protein n=1 Tax=Pseudoxanthomonas broegbernensis TaxID=83619 RepID=A0A7V8K679_9GAMM|nr:hypothetical protein [Pseudoxanthomonas broegbernensis]KAF1685476.1 hypothetical protein B1992_12105 [Pseudoxanthomonas broegbernensis]MBB6064388.1 hypothetical protein [Pseudoxanthomonas broegbernensis]
MREGIYRKTDAGRDEIRDRGRRLPPPLRTVLLMVDGQRTLSELRELATGVRAQEDALERLLAEELIELVPSGFDAAGLMRALGPAAPATAAAAVPPSPSPPSPAAVEAVEEEPAAAAPAGTPGDTDRYVRLHTEMSEAVRGHLGLRGYFLQLKIERCKDLGALQGVLPELRQALAKGKGEAFATDWEARLADPG